MNTVIDFTLANPGIFWLIVGTVFLIVEILAPWGFFLSFAASSYLLALLSWIGLLPSSFMVVAAVWAAIGVVLILPLKTLIRRHLDRQPDINTY